MNTNHNNNNSKSTMNITIIICMCILTDMLYSIYILAINTCSCILSGKLMLPYQPKMGHHGPSRTISDY